MTIITRKLATITGVLFLASALGCASNPVFNSCVPRWRDDSISDTLAVNC